MYYGSIKPFDIANGPGIRVSLFVSGCTNACPGCFNEESWSFTYGEEFNETTMEKLVGLLADPNVAGLSILGGDPFEPANIDAVTDICKEIKERFPGKTIWLWTGYDFLDFVKHPITEYLDVVIDGRYEEDKRDLSLYYRGSWNQRVIDVKESLKHGCAIKLKGKWK